MIRSEPDCMKREDVKRRRIPKRLRITRICSADVFRRSRHEAPQRYGVNREGRGEPLYKGSD